MKRLIRNIKLNKTANFSKNKIETFTLPSGDIIGFDYRMVNNKPRYQVYQEGLYNISSFIDTDDYDEAARMYKDLMTAFNGIKETESFNKYEQQIKSEIQEKIEHNLSNQQIKFDERFLGMPNSKEF